MFEDIRKQLYNEMAMKSAGKVLQSQVKSSEMTEADLREVIDKQVQPLYEYKSQIDILDSLEKAIQEQEVNVSIDGKGLEQIGKAISTYLNFK